MRRLKAQLMSKFRAKVKPHLIQVIYLTQPQLAQWKADEEELAAARAGYQKAKAIALRASCIATR